MTIRIYEGVNRHGVRRSQFHSASAEAAKAPYPLAPSSFSQSNPRCWASIGFQKEEKQPRVRLSELSPLWGGKQSACPTLSVGAWPGPIPGQLRAEARTHFVDVKSARFGTPCGRGHSSATLPCVSSQTETRFAGLSVCNEKTMNGGSE